MFPAPITPITECPHCGTANAGGQSVCRRCGGSLFEDDRPGERLTVDPTPLHMSFPHILFGAIDFLWGLAGWLEGDPE